MQNIGLFTIKCSVRKSELFLVTIYATDKADVFGNVIVRFQFLGVAEGDGIADILEPVLCRYCSSFEGPFHDTNNLYDVKIHNF